MINHSPSTIDPSPGGNPLPFTLIMEHGSRTENRKQKTENGFAGGKA